MTRALWAAASTRQATTKRKLKSSHPRMQNSTASYAASARDLQQSWHYSVAEHCLQLMASRYRTPQVGCGEFGLLLGLVQC